MSESADEFNERELDAGRIKPAHVSELVARFQRDNGLDDDGKAGPKTRAMIELLRGKLAGMPRAEPTIPLATSPRVELPELLVSESGWLSGAGVVIMPIHASWYYRRLSTANGKPAAIVAHYTATAHGTAINMAKRRGNPLDTQPTEVDGDPEDRQASWHLSIEGDGTMVQMAPLLVGCWHAGGKTAKPIAGVGPANKTAVGVELVGYGDAFPVAQVDAAKRVWRALVRAYAIPRGLAMVKHSELDPTRKADPGPVWALKHSVDVIDYAFA